MSDGRVGFGLLNAAFTVWFIWAPREICCHVDADRTSSLAPRSFAPLRLPLLAKPADGAERVAADCWPPVLE